MIFFLCLASYASSYVVRLFSAEFALALLATMFFSLLLLLITEFFDDLFFEKQCELLAEFESHQWKRIKLYAAVEFFSEYLEDMIEDVLIFRFDFFNEVESHLALLVSSYIAYELQLRLRITLDETVFAQKQGLKDELFAFDTELAQAFHSKFKLDKDI